MTDNGNSTLGLTIAPGIPAGNGLGFAASRNITGTWSLGTITSPDKIREMQAVYQRAVAAKRKATLPFAG